MFIKKFEDIVVWNKAKELTLCVYKKLFNIKDYGFKDQIQRASISIMNNVAEGFGRNKRNEFLYFLRVAKGSCLEVSSMVYIAKELSYLNEEDFVFLHSLCEEIYKMIFSFMRYLENNKTIN